MLRFLLEPSAQRLLLVEGANVVHVVALPNWLSETDAWALLHQHRLQLPPLALAMLVHIVADFLSVGRLVSEMAPQTWPCTPELLTPPRADAPPPDSDAWN